MSAPNPECEERPKQDSHPVFRGLLSRLGGLGTAFAVAILASCYARTALAAPVSLAKAKTAAGTFASVRYPATPILPEQHRQLNTTVRWERGDILLGYVGQLEPAGFVLLRPDDELPPVKVYSSNGRFAALPPAFLDVLEWEIKSELTFLADLQSRAVP